MLSKELSKSLELFSLNNHVSLESIKERYRTLIKSCHPDKHPDNAGWATQKASEVNAAYETLISHLDELTQAWQVDQYISDLHKADQAIIEADENLRDAVIIGLLRRKAKSDWGERFRKNMILACQKLIHSPDKPRLLFFKGLFSAFIKATDPSAPRSLPLFRNTTRFFKYLHKSHLLLETGIRNYYHFRQQIGTRSYENIPASFLEDAIHLYQTLQPQLSEELAANLEHRVSLARFFLIRLNKKELR